MPSKSGKLFELNFTYRSARLAVREAMNSAASEKGLARVARFIQARTGPVCGGTRLSGEALGTEVTGINLAQASAKTLDEALAWVPAVVGPAPPSPPENGSGSSSPARSAMKPRGCSMSSMSPPSVFIR